MGETLRQLIGGALDRAALRAATILGPPSPLETAKTAALVREIDRLRREVEFEANAEPWGSGTIVAPEGHGYINGGNRCQCGYPTPTLRTYATHTASLLRACACVTDEQAAQLAPGFSRPVCAVHTEVRP